MFRSKFLNEALSDYATPGQRAQLNKWVDAYTKSGNREKDALDDLAQLGNDPPYKKVKGKTRYVVGSEFDRKQIVNRKGEVDTDKYGKEEVQTEGGKARTRYFRKTEPEKTHFRHSGVNPSLAKGFGGSADRYVDRVNKINTLKGKVAGGDIDAARDLNDYLNKPGTKEHKRTIRSLAAMSDGVKRKMKGGPGEDDLQRAADTGNWSNIDPNKEMADAALKDELEKASARGDHSLWAIANHQKAGDGEGGSQWDKFLQRQKKDKEKKEYASKISKLNQTVLNARSKAGLTESLLSVVENVMAHFNLVNTCDSRDLVSLWNRTHNRTPQQISEMRGVRVRDAISGKFVPHDFDYGDEQGGVPEGFNEGEVEDVFDNPWNDPSKHNYGKNASSSGEGNEKWVINRARELAQLGFDGVEATRTAQREFKLKKKKAPVLADLDPKNRALLRNAKKGRL